MSVTPYSIQLLDVCLGSMSYIPQALKIYTKLLHIHTQLMYF